MYWRGLTHDLSKFSPTEFFESVKYYNGSRSPIELCKEKNSYSKAWLHHKGRNDHHYEYWQGDFDSGINHIKMPYKSFCEMICPIYIITSNKLYHKNSINSIYPHKVAGSSP